MQLLNTFMKSLAIIGLASTAVLADDDSRSQINAHCLDITTGQPATGVNVTLEYLNTTLNDFSLIGYEVTDSGGEAYSLIPNSTSIAAGTYRMTFYPMDYFGSDDCFYEYIPVVFVVTSNQTTEDFHVPILLSNYGYSTYR
eukprot:Pgem_evm1s2720